MQPLTAEWVDKAEGDLTVASREIRARKAPNYDAACFHAQQCAEKYLKAVLQEEGIAFPKTHYLERLLNLVLPFEPGWNVLRVDLIQLSTSAIEVRYPGNSAIRNEARESVRVCKEVRARVRHRLSLPV